jgi:endonuclease V-like protein UPF0215 family
VAGIEDGSFEAFRRGSTEADQYTLLCLTRMQGTVIQDVLLRRILVDGLDATEKLLDMLSGLRVDAVILGGVTFAGFNVVDVECVNSGSGVPVIVFSAERPDAEATLAALRKHFSDWRERWSRYEALGEIRALRIGGYPAVYYECVGCSAAFAEDVLVDQAVYIRTPEAVRVAGMVAKGLSSAVRGPAVSAGGS